MGVLNNLKLITPRLDVLPLDYNGLISYKNDNPRLERELGLSYFNRKITDELKCVIDNYLIPYITQHPTDILYATIWIIVERTNRHIVGDIGFNAAPSENGVIEIGYSTFADFRNRGYMSEALSAMRHWASDQKPVRSIVAQTAKDNLYSQKVLINNYFQCVSENEDHYWWNYIVNHGMKA